MALPSTKRRPSAATSRRAVPVSRLASMRLCAAAREPGDVVMRRRAGRPARRAASRDARDPLELFARVRRSAQEPCENAARLALDVARRDGLRRRDQNAVLEGDDLAGLEREVELLRLVELLVAERIGREESVAARMPVRRVARRSTDGRGSRQSPASPRSSPPSSVHLARVLHTASPCLPSLLRYLPVTPVLSSTGTGVALPDASVNTSGFSAGCSSARVTRMPRKPSLLSLNTTFWSSAVSVVLRSMVRESAPPRNTNRVVSLSSCLLSGVIQAVSTVSSPRSAPLLALTTLR